MSDHVHHGRLAKAGISELAIALYEIEPGFKYLAEKQLPAHVSASDLAAVHGVGRRYWLTLP